MSTKTSLLPTGSHQGAAHLGKSSTSYIILSYTPKTYNGLAERQVAPGLQGYGKDTQVEAFAGHAEHRRSTSRVQQLGHIIL